MVDAVLSRSTWTSRPHPEVLSRHGLMPLAHAESDGTDTAPIDALHALGLRGRLRLIHA